MLTDVTAQTRATSFADGIVRPLAKSLPLVCAGQHCKSFFKGITSQTNKFAALTTLLTEEEAYVVRDLTLLGRERPADVFDTARKLFVQRFDLTIR